MSRIGQSIINIPDGVEVKREDNKFLVKGSKGELIAPIDESVEVTIVEKVIKVKLIINIAKNKNIKIILAGMLAPESYGSKYKKEFDAIYPRLSNKYNLALIPFLLEGVALNPILNQQDGIHPNKEGTIKVSENIKKSIINVLN